MRGVNLGGWLLLEQWITPAFFEEVNIGELQDKIVDEWTTFQNYRYRKSLRRKTLPMCALCPADGGEEWRESSSDVTPPQSIHNIRNINAYGGKEKNRVETPSLHHYRRTKGANITIYETAPFSRQIHIQNLTTRYHTLGKNPMFIRGLVCIL